jgi:RNA binding exosome subunit
MTKLRGLDSYPVKGLEISVFSHATEDESKVERAVMNVLPKDISNIKRKFMRLFGYFKDPIILMRFNLSKNKDATNVLVSVIKSLTNLDALKLINEVEERMDEKHNFYIRLDKQKAYSGNISLKQTDSIRLKFIFRSTHNINPVVLTRSFINNVLDEH